MPHRAAPSTRAPVGLGARVRDSLLPLAELRTSGRIAHEMNNLIAVILGYTDLLLADMESEESGIQADLTEVRIAAIRARELTKELAEMDERERRSLPRRQA